MQIRYPGEIPCGPLFPTCKHLPKEAGSALDLLINLIGINITLIWIIHMGMVTK